MHEFIKRHKLHTLRFVFRLLFFCMSIPPVWKGLKANADWNSIVSWTILSLRNYGIFWYQRLISNPKFNWTNMLYSNEQFHCDSKVIWNPFSTVFFQNIVNFPLFHAHRFITDQASPYDGLISTYSKASVGCLHLLLYLAMLPVSRMILVEFNMPLSCAAMCYQTLVYFD